MCAHYREQAREIWLPEQMDSLQRQLLDLDRESAKEQTGWCVQETKNLLRVYCTGTCFSTSTLESCPEEVPGCPQEIPAYLENRHNFFLKTESPWGNERFTCLCLTFTGKDPTMQERLVLSAPTIGADTTNIYRANMEGDKAGEARLLHLVLDTMMVCLGLHHWMDCCPPWHQTGWNDSITFSGHHPYKMSFHTYCSAEFSPSRGLY